MVVARRDVARRARGRPTLRPASAVAGTAASAALRREASAHGLCTAEACPTSGNWQSPFAPAASLPPSVPPPTTAHAIKRGSGDSALHAWELAIRSVATRTPRVSTPPRPDRSTTAPDAETDPTMQATPRRRSSAGRDPPHSGTGRGLGRRHPSICTGYHDRVRTTQGHATTQDVTLHCTRIAMPFDHDSPPATGSKHACCA